MKKSKCTYPWVMVYRMPNGSLTYGKKFKLKKDVILEDWMSPWMPLTAIQLKPLFNSLSKEKEEWVSGYDVEW